jgi:AraC-like DNA-binding protein
MEFISAIASINALILAFLIYIKKGKTISDKILIFWVINFALHFAIPFLVDRQVLIHESYWGILMGVFIVAHAPFLFVYTNSLTNPHFKANFKNLYHFLVIVLFIAASIPYLLLPQEERMALALKKQDLSHEMFLPMMVLLFCRVYYLIRTILILAKHQYSMKQVFSYDEAVNLTWLKRITYGFFSLILLYFIAFGLVSAQLLNIFWMDYSLIVVNIILFFYIAYSGYKQKLIYTTEDSRHIVADKKSRKEVIPNTNNSQNKNNSSETELDPIITDLKKSMLNNKLYLEPELNIGDLANKIGIHAHQLSKLINSQLNKNFFEFVNEYRVDEFKKLATNPKNKHISIFGLALDAGFNSRATFYRFFKNTTGLTPTEFRNNFKF